jgi:hypothetical protein
MILERVESSVLFGESQSCFSCRCSWRVIRIGSLVPSEPFRRDAMALDQGCSELQWARILRVSSAQRDLLLRCCLLKTPSLEMLRWEGYIHTTGGQSCSGNCVVV